MPHTTLARLFVPTLSIISTVAFSTPASAGYVDENGWTIFNPSNDTRIIYVSASEGTDYGNPVYYHRSSLELGGNPFQPTEEIRAYRTLGAAYEVLRSGKDDWILLKRGDAWDEGFTSPRWANSGFSSTRPMLISAYGIAPTRPQITEFATRYGPNDPQDAFDHVAISGIRFTQGIDRVIGGRGFLIEDCYFDECGVALQGLTPQNSQPGLFDVSIRRSILFGNYSTTSRAQNLFVRLVDGLTIEETVVDRGGWNPNVLGAESSQYNHNVYVQKDVVNVTFKGNISSRASSHGAQLRRGGLCEDNLFLQNPIGLLIGSNQIDNWPTIAGSGTVRQNVFLDSRNITGNPRGHAMWFEQIDNVEVSQNIAAHQLSGSLGVAVVVGLNHRGFNFHNNIIYNWTKPGNMTDGKVMKFNNNAHGTNVIRSNVFQQPGGGELIEHTIGFSQFTFASNTYYSMNTSNDWFRPSGSLAAWINASGEIGAISEQVEFTDPQRDIKSYMSSIGFDGGLEEFLEEARQQSKSNWRPAFTASAVNTYIRDGFDMNIKVGEQAKILSIDVLKGQLVRGGLWDILFSDDTYFEALPRQPLFPTDSWVMEVQIIAESQRQNATSFDLTVESYINAPSARATVSLRNWQLGGYESVYEYTIGLQDQAAQIDGLLAARYIRSIDGHIDMLIRHETPVPMFPVGARSSFDLAECVVR